MGRRQVPQVPPAIRVAQEALAAAEQRRQTLKRQYDDALTEAIQREQRPTSGPAVYTQAAVIIQDERVALLRKQLQAATVAATEARAHYGKLSVYYLTRPGGVA